MARVRRSRGFTLVEMLVALFAMALLAMLSWRGLDGMARVQQQTQARADEVLVLQTGLAQWRADLDALVEMPQQTALDWNGRVLRLTRQDGTTASGNVVVVGWARRVVDGSSRWLRWQSLPLNTRGDLDAAWEQADLWSQNPGETERRNEVAVVPLEDWRVFFFRGGAWTNPQSNATTTAQVTPGTNPVPETPLGTGTGTGTGSGTASTPASGVGSATRREATPIPEGVRLVLTLPEGHAISGELIRDWTRQ
jgi:general secretion pathway protein J